VVTRLLLFIGLGKGDKFLPKSFIATNNIIKEIMIIKKPKKYKKGVT